MFRPLKIIATKTGAIGARWHRVATAAPTAKPRISPAVSIRALHHLAAAANGDVSSSWITQQQQRRQQVRTVFIQTENTPNPESIKFVPSGRVVLESEDGTGYFVQKTDPMEDILKSPLATQLFKIDGVKAVYLGFDFVTITKYAENNW